MATRDQQSGDVPVDSLHNHKTFFSGLHATPASCNTSYANLGVGDDHSPAQLPHIRHVDGSGCSQSAAAQPLRVQPPQGREGIPAATQQKRPKKRKRQREAVTLLSSRHFGLLVSLAFASVLTSCIKRGLLPILKSELNLSSSQFDAAQILMILPWACSFFLGFCSDTFPIFGRHRKSYMMLGWSVTSLALFVLAFVNYVQEYDKKIKNQDPSLALADRTRVLNLYVALLGLASFGGILSVIVAEIYVIQQSRRESLRNRGHMVGTFLLTQFFFEMLGQLLTDLVIFRVTKFGVLPLYSFRNVVLFFVIYALVPIPALLCFFDERIDDADVRQLTEQKDLELAKRQRAKEHHALDSIGDDDDQIDDEYDPATVAILGDQTLDGAPRGMAALKAHLAMVMETLRRESTWRIVRFLALFIFFTEFTLNYPHLTLDKWCGMTLKLESSGKILAEALYFIAVFTWKVLCFNLDWRILMTGTLLGVFIIPQSVYFFLAIFDIGRNSQVYVIFKSLRGFLRGMIVVIEVSMAVEVTPRGSEGATLGVLVSIGTVMRLLAATCSNILGEWLKNPDLEGASTKNDTISRSDSDDTDGAEVIAGLDDTSAIRHHVASLLAICFCIRVLALFALKYLPRQRKYLQVVLRRERELTVGSSGNGSQGVGGNAAWILAVLLGSLAFVAIVNAWVVTPEPLIAACGRGGGLTSTGC